MVRNRLRQGEKPPPLHRKTAFMTLSGNIFSLPFDACFCNSLTTSNFYFHVNYPQISRIPDGELSRSEFFSICEAFVKIFLVAFEVRS